MVWDDLPRLAVPLDLVVGTRDRTVPPEQAQRVMALLAPAARGEFVQLEGLGHLAHEERPEGVSEWIARSVKDPAEGFA